MIEIETKEMDKASEYAEKALKYMGKVMQCLTEWEEEGGFGERGGQGGQGGGSYGSRSMMGSRGGYGGRGGYGSRGGYGEREEDEWEEEEMMSSMRERRGVRGSGRGRR